VGEVTVLALSNIVIALCFVAYVTSAGRSRRTSGRLLETQAALADKRQEAIEALLGEIAAKDRLIAAQDGLLVELRKQIGLYKSHFDRMTVAPIAILKELKS
jgi:hypothetical protein